MIEKEFKNKYGSWAIVVGSAEGLGEAYTIALAERNMNLILVDNQLTALTAISKKIKSEYNIETFLLHIDLKEEKVDCRLLIYNAAYSLIKPFVNHTEEELDSFIDINTRTQLKLIHQFSKHLVEKRQKGGILLMSSLAGLIGMQLVSSYAATKAFAWNLAEALHHELKPKNIDVMACIAGATSTPAYLKTKPTYGFIKPLVMQPKIVAESTLKKLGKQALFIPGFSNRLNYFILTRLIPRKIAASVANKTMLTMFKQQSNN